MAPTSAAQRLTDAAYEMNTATRFGRMDVAAEHVASKSMEDFQKHHVEWGRRVRIVDLEFGGARVEEKDNATVSVAVTWQKPDDAVVRSTTITQHWHDDKGTWHLVSEETKAGDDGLLGEPPPKPGAAPAAAPAAKPGNRFQTHVIYEEDPGSASADPSN